MYYENSMAEKPFETREVKKVEEKEPKEDPVAAAASAAARAVIEEMMPAMLAAMRAGAAGSELLGAPPVKPRTVDHGPTCAVCGQYVKACKNEHARMCVYPTQYPEFGPWFQGIVINGKQYLSNGPGHDIPVPKVAEGDIRCAIRLYEDSERTARLGRVITPSKNRIVPREEVGEYQ
jgi:ferredoxin